MTRPSFAYSEAVASRYPTACASVITVSGLTNHSSPGLSDAVEAIQAEVAGSLVEFSPADRPSIKAWRQAFSAMGVKPTQHRNAAEALLRRLKRNGDIPSINPAVDLGNAVSVRHALPVAVFDLDAIALPLTVVFANGDETFMGIGAGDGEHPEPGEVIFVDADRHVVARRWCWKQSATAATSPATVNALFVIEAVHDDAQTATSAAADELAALAGRHFPDASIHRAATAARPDENSYSGRQS